MHYADEKANSACNSTLHGNHFDSHNSSSKVRRVLLVQVGGGGALPSYLYTRRQQIIFYPPLLPLSSHKRNNNFVILSTGHNIDTRSTMLLLLGFLNILVYANCNSSAKSMLCPHDEHWISPA
jgi:hypothetical protein